MSVIYVLLVISIVIAGSGFIAFILSVRSGQYDDIYTPSVRMLFEDELVKEKPSDDKIKKGSVRCEKTTSPAGRRAVGSKPKQTDGHAAPALTDAKNNPTK